MTTAVRAGGPATRWLLAYTAAILGDVSYYLVLTWAAGEAGGPLWTGVVLAVGAIPRAALMLVGGLLADHLDPRRIAIATDAARAVLLVGAASAAAVLGPMPWWLLALSLSFGVVDACFIPAVGALPARLVTPDTLPRLQAWRITGLRIGNAIGPAVGALLLTLGLAAALASIALLFVVSVGLLLTVRTRVAAIAPRRGMRSVAPVPLGELRRRGLLPLVAATALSELPFSGPVAIGIVLLAQERAWPPAVAGALLTVFSLGGLASGVILGSLPRRLLGGPGAARGVVLGGLALGAGILALLPAADAGTAVVLGGVLGAATGATMVVGHGRIQQATPPELLGRVTALLSLATLGLGPVAYGAVGTIAATAGLGTVFAVLAGTLVCAAVVLVSARGLLARPAATAMEKRNGPGF
ncbi:MFS transporter [Microbacterium resistens]|uniref:MFS transporter n=1 Tax=Microbacterium resistens TaxID=156977 RepID=UPI00366C4C87